MKVPRRQECRLATVYANGLKDASKSDAVALRLMDFPIGVCVASETHLRIKDITDVKKYCLEFGNQVGAHNCRKSLGGRGRTRRKGGVAILVRNDVSHAVLGKIPRPEPPINTYLATVFPSGNPEERFRIAGLYCPPPPSGRANSNPFKPIQPPSGPRSK